jgi:hypothetical protein
MTGKALRWGYKKLLRLPTYYTPGERCDTSASSSSFLVRARDV